MRTKSALTAADTATMMAAAKAEAQKNGWKVAIAIVDYAGHLLHLERLDGANGMTAEVATGKARTSGLTGRPSKFWEERIKERPAFLTYPGAAMFQGGLPVTHNGDCVGGIGVSGVQSHEDEQVAQAGIAALG